MAQAIRLGRPVIGLEQQEIEMREFLVTKMVCATCGGNLQLTYDVPTRAGHHAQGEPTGAHMVQQLVAVEPCRKCMAPLEQMRAAAKTLFAV